ncbi:F20B24.3 [Arabidopsis thaliana]|uniref:F20B24.3 n=1 Tax=Arabidopsis thaliana TaxID=3702 RepID=Q9SGZ0_ARATH|nr:F20B24.3 [Arabidopsis thaliana]
MGFIRKKKASSFHIVECCYQNPYRYSTLFCFKSLYGRFQAHDSFLRTVKSKTSLFLTLSSLSTDVTVTSVTDLGTETRRRFTLLSFSLSGF